MPCRSVGGCKLGAPLDLVSLPQVPICCFILYLHGSHVFLMILAVMTTFVVYNEHCEVFPVLRDLY